MSKLSSHFTMNYTLIAFGRYYPEVPSDPTHIWSLEVHPRERRGLIERELNLDDMGTAEPETDAYWFYYAPRGEHNLQPYG